MRFPWPFKRRTERRQSGGDFTDSVVRAAEAAAAAKAADAGSTAAVEAAAGLLSRSLAAASVDAPEWARDAVCASYLAQVGRDLIRRGASLHVIRVGDDGMAALWPVSSWHWEGRTPDPKLWTVRATAFGPSGSLTWDTMPQAGVVFHRWGSTPGAAYVGLGPLGWASTSAKVSAETERSLGDESAGPLANLLPIPDDGGDDDADEEDDPLRDLKSDIASARGAALLVETTAAGWGDGMRAAPRTDWIASRLGPHPPESMVRLAADAFDRTLAACGMNPGLFSSEGDGTRMREGLRQFHLSTVLPLAKLIEAELSAKLETDIGLRFDLYATDLAGRAQAFAKLVAGGMELDRAAAVSGILSGE